MNKKYFYISNNGEIIGNFDSDPSLDDASIVIHSYTTTRLNAHPTLD